MKAIRNIYRGLAWVILAAVLLQFFFAGLGVFKAGGYGPHALVGLLLVLLSLILLILALVLRPDRRTVGIAALMFALMVVQMFLAHFPVHLVAALHPVNALILLYLSFTLAHGKRTALTETAPA